MSIDKFYIWLVDVKEEKRHTWHSLGAVIQKSGNAMRFAVKNKSLTVLEKEKLRSELDPKATKDLPTEDDTTEFLKDLVQLQKEKIELLKKENENLKKLYEISEPKLKKVADSDTKYK